MRAAVVVLGCCVNTDMNHLCICTPMYAHMQGLTNGSVGQMQSGMPYWTMTSSPLYPKELLVLVGIDVGWHRGPGSPPIAVGIDVGMA